MSVATIEFNPIGCLVETTGHQKFGESNFWDVGSLSFLTALSPKVTRFLKCFFLMGPL